MLKLISILFLLVSCSKKFDTPEETLTYIVEQLAKGNNVSEFFTQDIEDKDLAPISNIRDLKIKVLSSSCSSEDKCQLVYVVNYDQVSGQTRTDKLEIKKVAELAKEDDKWKIFNIIEMKTFIDSKSSLEIK